MDNILRIILIACCLAFLCRQGATVMYMFKDVNITMMTLNCTVDELFSGIDFTYPNNNYGHAYCVVPGISGDTQCYCSCTFTLTCKCKITQDISTKTTTLQIVDTDLTGMFGWYTCAHGSYKESALVTSAYVWLEKEVNDTMIKLRCIPDEFKSRIDFYFPNISLGHACCSTPIPELSSGQCNCSCNATSACKCSIIQEISTKTTTLLIQDNDLTSLVGLYTCVHGSTNKTTMVSTPATQGYGPKSMAASYILLSIVIVCSILFCLCTRKVLNKFEEKKCCSSCMFASVSAICTDCQKSYCDFCLMNHMQYNPEHRICQKQLTTRTQQRTICGQCGELAAKLCKTCSRLRCLSCYHPHQDMVRIYPLPTVSKTQTTKRNQYKINNVNTVSFQKDESPVRIYGIGYLADGTLFALDGSNLKLIVFNSKNKQLTEAFQDEPCAITSMSGNQVAVTFPYNRLIRIYEIDVEEKTLMKEVKRITMVDLEVPKLKPYSISYNQNCFAIEVGEREDGIIIIYDNSKSQQLHKIKCEIAYFTGHTIRLVLDMSEELLFISAMGKRMVYCMDFNRNLKWDITIASPRSMTIPKDSLFGNSVILSSRRCNAIYVLNKESGEEICHHRISSPRYTAYNSKENKLCVHVNHVKNKNTNTNENEKHTEDELIFVEFQIIQECNSETKLLDHVVKK